LCTAILWVCGVLYWAFMGNYGCLYIIISICVALRGIAAVFICSYCCGFVAIYRCYYLYYASIVHEVVILCVSGVDSGVFVCYHTDSQTTKEI
jgi:hypothetical protein